MRILKTAPLFLLICFFCMSCTPSAPISPEDAFNTLKKAYQKEDGRMAERVYSKESIARVQKMIASFSAMEQPQRKTVAKHLMVEPDDLQNMTVQKYLTFSLQQSSRISGDVVRTALLSGIAAVELHDDHAQIKSSNGIELPFVKEGLYWKFDAASL